MANDLIQALRAGKLASVRAAIKADPQEAKRPRAIVEAGRLAFQAAIELLHKNGADLNSVRRGYRPLHALLQEEPHAAAGKPPAERLACLEWLLKHGADPEQLGAWPPARAIIIAAFVGAPEYVQRLRKGGAKIDGFAGAALGDVKLVRKTLRARPEFARERDVGGLTALQCAAGSRFSGDSFAVARSLIEAGADVGAQTKSWGHDVDAIYFAASAKNKALFELLLEHGADASQALVPALWNADLEFAGRAMAHGGDPDRAVTEGKPLLNHLICWGQVRQALWLLAHRANPNLPDQRGWTAVHQAASRGNQRMMQAVLEAGGDPGRRDKEGSTPLNIAKAVRRAKLVDMMSASATR